MRKSWWRELLRRRSRRNSVKPRPNDVRLLGFEEMEERRMLALPPGVRDVDVLGSLDQHGPVRHQHRRALQNVALSLNSTDGTAPEDTGLTNPAPTDPVEGSVTSIATDPANPAIGWVERPTAVFSKPKT